MTFQFSRQGLSGRERALERVFEILPGAVSWTILLGMLFLTWWHPRMAAILVIAFDVYWLLRLFYMTIFLVLAYLRLSIERETDWMERVRAVDRQQPGAASSGLNARLSAWLHRRRLSALRRSGRMPPPSSDLYHLVLFPIVREPREVIEPGIESLARQAFSPRQLLVVLALEERAPEHIQEGVRAVQERYRDRFLDLLVVRHPDGLPGEARVKGANVTYAAKAAIASLTERGIPIERVIVSCFDADTVVGPEYIACLTYHFMVHPERTQASFQPIPVYHNNIWEAPGFARVLDIGSSFFQLIESTNPEKLVTFSSHSMSGKALVDVGYWPVDMISDDSAIFWKAFIHFDGRYRVVPMYVTLSMDVVNAGSWWKTVQAVYRQKRRWAWGVENFPIVMRAFLRAKRISLYDKIRHSVKLLEGHIGWATWAFLLGVIGWLPALLAAREFSTTVLYYSAPRITAIIFSLSSLALATTILLSLCLLPKRPATHPLLKQLAHAVEWLQIPLIAVFLSALPALDAQTRLLRGRYMEFWVTEKLRGNPVEKRLQ